MGGEGDQNVALIASFSRMQYAMHIGPLFPLFLKSEAQKLLDISNRYPVQYCRLPKEAPDGTLYF